jgi:hypothetical protein
LLKLPAAGDIYLGTRVKTVMRRSSISWTLVTRYCRDKPLLNG